MPITVEMVDASATQSDITKVFDYFTYVDQTFSTYKTTSEITKINEGLLALENASDDMKEVFLLCDKTKQETSGYFGILNQEGKLDPSGLVKGWAIFNASELLKNSGFKNFYIEAGGDIQVQGHNGEGKPWKVGIKNPFNVKEIIKVVHLKNNEGIATSGSYERGSHIYNPLLRPTFANATAGRQGFGGQAGEKRTTRKRRQYFFGERLFLNLFGFLWLCFLLERRLSASLIPSISIHIKFPLG